MVMQMDNLAGFQMSRALKAVRNISRQHNIPLHGIVLDLVDSLPQLYTAIEVCEWHLCSL